jgi:hypothetical protein
MRYLSVAALVTGAVAGLSSDAEAIPAFARKYRVSCQLCHNPAPRLTAFGSAFAANGFRLSSAEPPRDTVNTGDPLLDLLATLPLAIRLDAYAQAYTEGTAVTDFASPYGLKLLSGGTISSKISYYLYFFLLERGEVGGIEDAFVYINDIAGAPIDVAVGQFQVSDPLFKRELRLEIDDYAMYRARIGDGPTDLTYDRGVLASAEFAGFTLSAEIINGNGKGPAEANRRFDNNNFKNLFGHLTRDLTPNVRVGTMGYYGEQRGVAASGIDTLVNTVWMAGGDLTVAVGPVELNGQFIHREDDNATFTAGEPTVTTNGGFAEVVVTPAGSRWYGVALYNYIDTSAPLLDVRLGGPAGLTRYQTLTGGLGYLVRRNVRVYGEATWDVEQDNGRFGLGITAAF